MTWANRFRFLLGLLLVLAIVAAGTIVFTQRQNRADSTGARIDAEQYDVGAVYAGTVSEQFVEPGDVVRAGDPLVEIRSPQLARDLEADVIEAGDLDDVDTGDGTYRVLAAVDGTVADVLTPVGDFVPGGQILATIDRAGTLTVSAEFLLTAREYGRLAEGSAVAVVLPDGTAITGHVDEIAVETIDGRAASTLLITSPALAGAEIGGLYRPGTPVTATVELRDDGPLSGVDDAVRDFLHRIGL